MVPRINTLLNEIDELNRKKEEGRENLSKKKSENKARLRELEEEKKRVGLRGDRSSVLKITRQIQRLKDEIDNVYEHEFDLEIKRCNEKINEIIVDYYKNNITIKDIFLKENISPNIQEEWLEKSNFGVDTGILYVDKINESKFFSSWGYYNRKNYSWRYYNPFLEIKLKAETLKSLKNIIESQGQKFIVFNEILFKTYENLELKKSQSSMENKSVQESEIIDSNESQSSMENKSVQESEIIDSTDYQSMIEEKLDKLDGSSLLYVAARGILNDLYNSKVPLTKEQINRLCEISINRYHIYDCYTCTDVLKKILKKYENQIDEGLLKEVIEKNNISNF